MSNIGPTSSSSPTPPKGSASTRGEISNRVSRVFQGNIPPLVPNLGSFLLLGRFIVNLFTEKKKKPSAPPTLPQSLQNPSSASGEDSFVKPVIRKKVSTERPPLIAKPIPEFSPSVKNAINDFIEEDDDRDDVVEILLGVSIPEGTDRDMYLVSIIREAKSFRGNSDEQKIENLLFVAILKRRENTAKLSQRTKITLENSFKMMKDPLARNRLVHAIASIGPEIESPTSLGYMIELEIDLRKNIPDLRGDYEIDRVNHFIGTLLYPKENWIGYAVAFLKENEYIGEVPLFFQLVKEYKDKNPQDPNPQAMEDLFKRVLKELSNIS